MPSWPKSPRHSVARAADRPASHDPRPHQDGESSSTHDTPWVRERTSRVDAAQACGCGPSCSDLVRATGRCGRRLGADHRAGVDRARCPCCPGGCDNVGHLPATTRCGASARPGVHTVCRRRGVERSGCRRRTGYDCARRVHCRPGAGCRRIWADPAADRPQHLPDTEDPDVEGPLSSGQVEANRLVMRPGFAGVVVPEPAPRLRHTVLSTIPLARRCAERW